MQEQSNGNRKRCFINKAHKLGFEYEKQYRGCSQCTVAAIQDAFGIRNDFIFQAASGLGAGGGLLGDGMCGGYSGGTMMMSAFFGRSRERIDSDNEEKYCAFRMARALHDIFIREYGSIICNNIQCKIFGRAYDLWNPKEKEAFNRAGAHEDKCTQVVANASGWAVELILEEISSRGLSISDFKI